MRENWIEIMREFEEEQKIRLESRRIKLHEALQSEMQRVKQQSFEREKELVAELKAKENTQKMELESVKIDEKKRSDEVLNRYISLSKSDVLRVCERIIYGNR